ncbi:ABC transporter substrate-binding protein [Mycolicibacterium sp. YH-1]|uniref:ABC transporter substrate-binding protein n=1 Tax=Mycolicibacterium sp. YH-1 TaxID=2908837 RepID=UPI001F4C200E|nr:ABC transporter substrate-binding protein [Mycolicibacterium sp. YH-1]UNB52065.1 ABC transporter substrate-binding protein [Mycolicibacterium sp. YH-1]
MIIQNSSNVVKLGLSVAVALAATACSGQQPSGDTITLVQGVKGNPFYVAMECGAKEQAAKLGVDLEVTAPDQFDASQQTPLVNAVAAKNPAAVLIAPTDAVAMRAPINNLISRGAKVIEVDTALDDTTISTSHITTDNFAAGEAAADKFNEILGGKGKILALSSAPGISTNDSRVEGLQEGLKAYPGLEFAGVQYTKEDATTAASIVSSSLSADPGINGIFSVNSPSSQGAATALRNNNAAERVKLIGFDAGPQQIEQLKNGAVVALVAQSPYQIGADGVQVAVDAIAGKDVPSDTTTPVMVLDTANVDTPEAQRFIYKTEC